MGRHKKPIDESIMVKLAERQWTDVQIAAAFQVDERTIQRRFAAKLAEARQAGKAKIIDLIWQRAVTDKSDKMLKELADRFLGAVPKAVELTGKDGAPVQTENIYTVRKYTDEDSK